MKMEDVECKRARKPVSYTEIADVALDEDDFDDFKISSKSKTEKVNDIKEKVNGEEQKNDRERKHHKDKHRDHKRHKDSHRGDRDRHRRDRDRHKGDRDRHREKHSRERDESKKREHKERQHRSERQDNKQSQHSGKGEEKSDSTCDSSGTQTLQDSPATSVPATTSPLVSPSRRNPKPRLSLEEKIFQRELQTVLELSKVESSQDSSRTTEPEEHGVTQEGIALSSRTPEPEEHGVTQEGIALDTKQEIQSQASPGGGKPPPTQDPKVTVEASPSTPDKSSARECVEEVVQIPDPPPPAPPLPPPAGSMDTMEPVPSTSTGKTAKRIRKTVVFKEDSDSDDFDGFGYDMDAESDVSEGSDFMPSPKKKKKSRDSKKNKNQAKTKPDKTKNSTRKSSCKSTGQNKKGDVMSSPHGHSVLAKENTAPKNSATPPSAKSTVVSPKVTTTPELKVSSSLPTPQPAKTSTKNTSVAKPVKRPLITMPSSPSSGAPSIALVKTPFRSPLSTSPNSGHPVVSPATSVGTKTLYRGTGLRLGLSRRANFKPLHPTVAGRPTN